MRVLGIDGGIASTGWAVLEFSDDAGEIIATGSRTFEAPETGAGAKRKLKNAERRTARGQRRVIRRRSRRMAAIRKLFANESLLSSHASDALGGHARDPWALRAQGLERALTPLEWAIVLGHIAKHRGFRSNRKGENAANTANDSSKMLKAMEQTRDRIARYGTVGAMFALDPAFSERKRNRTGDFTRSILRKDQEDEVAALFRAQRRFGQPVAGETFENTFAKLAFDQKEMASSIDKIGNCPFEPGEKRTTKHAPGFERFRFLSRLTTLRLRSGRDEFPLRPDQIAILGNQFGRSKGMTFKAVRKLLDLEANTRFASVSLEDEGNDVITGRAKEKISGAYLFRTVLKVAVGASELEKLLSETAELDRAAEMIAFHEDATEIAKEIGTLQLSPEAAAAIVKALADGEFLEFRGTSHISSLAARTLNPFLAEGLGYSDACAAAGYDHSAQSATSIEEIGSPVARKALSQMMKQVAAVHQAYGPFDRIHVEMAREVGKGLEERREIEEGMKKRAQERDRLSDELQEHLKIARVGGEDLLRYELWREQGCICLYTGESIPLDAVLATDNRVQVDHILPRSRFGDDSFVNKTLCFTSANAEKSDRTPYEWFKATKSDEEWRLFSARVGLQKAMKGRKKRNLLIQNTAEDETKFKSRNLNDTRYATRVLLAELKSKYFPDAPHCVTARPGPLTSDFRRAWGIERLKKDAVTGERLPDDRHHALDAIIVACITDGMLNRATRAFQQAEREGRSFDMRRFAPPWPGFREDVERVYATLKVSRAEAARARGKAHDATIKQIRDIDGEERVFERRSIEKLSESDLDLIPVPLPYGRVSDPQKLRDMTVEALRAWIRAGKPKDEASQPRSPAGDRIRKVRVMTTAKVAVRLNGGTVDRGEMARIDVFTKPNRHGRDEFFLIPIYPHEIATLPSPPDRAIQGGGNEAKWPVIDAGYTFRFSLNSMTLISVLKPDGEIIEGYLRNLDRNTGALTVSSINDSTQIRKGIGPRTVLRLQKLRIDRLGNISEVHSETRTWHGKACT
jgi:CRISPR-associated endonuclease Csn1